MIDFLVGSGIFGAAVFILSTLTSLAAPKLSDEAKGWLSAWAFVCLASFALAAVLFLFGHSPNCGHPGVGPCL